MNKSAWWAWAVKNSICIICWTALAVYFNKWWIALFSVLTMSSLQLGNTTQQKHYRICDGCGKFSPYADNHNEALDKAKEAGWVHYVDGNRDYCPECKNKF